MSRKFSQDACHAFVIDALNSTYVILQIPIDLLCVKYCVILRIYLLKMLLRYVLIVKLRHKALLKNHFIQLKTLKLCLYVMCLPDVPTACWVSL